MTSTGMPDPDDPRWRRKLDWNALHERLGPREVLQAKAQAAGLAFVDLERVAVSPEALALIGPALARELRILPLKRRKDTLWLALAEPDERAVDAVRAATGLRVVPVLCLGAALDAALESLTLGSVE